MAGVRAGLDDDVALNNLINFWLASQDDLRGQLRKVEREIKILTRSALNPVRLERLRIQALRTHDLLGPVDAIISDLVHGTETWLSQGGMASVYNAGQSHATRALGLASTAAFTLPHRAAAEVIAKDTYKDVLAATKYVDRDRKRLIREVSKELTGLGVGSGKTSVQGARRMAKRIGAQGIGTVTYKNGAVHGIGSYTEMLLRTKTTMAYNAGTLNQCKELGIVYVEILDGLDCGLVGHNDPDRANGMIVPLIVAQSYPLSHPNCVRTFAPRPDVSKAQVTSGNWQSVIPPDTLEEISVFEKALDAQKAEKASKAGRRTRGAQRRPRRDRGSSARERADKRLAEQQEAKRAANRRGRKKQLKEAKKILAEQIAEAEKANLGIDPRLMHKWNVTPQQIKNARPMVKGVKADIRALAKQEADDLQAFLFDKELDTIARPKKLVQYIDDTGRRKHRREQSGYDWLESLDGPVEGRVQHRMKQTSGYNSPDVLADNVRRVTGMDFTDDEAMDWLIDQWLREDGLRSIASGRYPKYINNTQNLLPEEFLGDGYNLEALWGVPDEAAAHIAAVQAEEAGKIAKLVLRGESEFGPSPWRMAVDEYVFELEYLDEVLSTATPIGQDGLGVSIYDDYVTKSAARLRELAPPGVDERGVMNPFELHDTIRRIAQAAEWD